MGICAMMLLAMSFISCNSLGNTFLLYDLSALPDFAISVMCSDPELPSTVRELCRKHDKDGVLFVYPTAKEHSSTRVDIINRDGSPGGLCLNGIRCAASYLWKKHRLPKRFTIQMGKRLIDCQKKHRRISLGVPVGKYAGEHTLHISNNSYIISRYAGHKVDVGNPHFINFAKIDPVWLAQHGNLLVAHPDFAHGTNIEFVQKISDSQYFMQIYERGVGYSQACGSACVALATLLYEQKRLPVGARINITMPGGQVRASIDHFGLVQIEAEKPHLIAHLVTS